MDFAFEEAIANKRLVNSDGTPAAIYVAPELPIEEPDFRFLEEIGQMSMAEVKAAFDADPNSRFCRRYKIAAVSHGYRLPYGVEPEPVKEERDPYETMTAREWHSIPVRLASRLMLTDNRFKRAVYRLIEEQQI